MTHHDWFDAPDQEGEPAPVFSDGREDCIPLSQLECWRFGIEVSGAQFQFALRIRFAWVILDEHFLF